MILHEIGEITLLKSSRAKHIRLSIRAFRGIRVTVPPGVAFGQAEKFVLANAAWLKKQLAKIKAFEREAAVQFPGPQIDVRTAKAQLVSRLHELAKRHGFSFHKVCVRNQRTRWGSCSDKNNISLNINLVKLPAHLIDYAILHELVHTRVKNHGPRFWAALEAVVADAKGLDRQLNQYGLVPIGIYNREAPISTPVASADTP